MDTTVARRWWILALRGLFGIIFGILCVIAPFESLLALVILFGIYAMLDGAFTLALGARRAPGGRTWPSLVFGGLASVVAGVLALVWPTISALALLMVIAAWSVASGIAAIVSAIRLRKEVKGEWLWVVNGVLSIAFGVLVFFFPGAGALALVLWIGAYAFVSGLMLVILGFRVRSWLRSHASDTPARTIPVHAQPAAPPV